MNPRPVTGDCEHRASSTYLDIDPPILKCQHVRDFLSTESFDQNETTNFKSIQVSCLHQKVNNINNETFITDDLHRHGHEVVTFAFKLNLHWYFHSALDGQG